MTDTTKLTQQTWQYAGRRYSGGKLYHKWISPTHPEGSLWAARLNGRTYSVGHRYVIRASEDGTHALLKSATYDANPYPVHPQHSEWKLADQEAMTLAHAAAAEKAAKQEQNDLSKMTLAEARQWIHGGAYGTTAARIAVVLRTLGMGA